MKQFFKFMFASMLGFFIGTMLFTLVLFLFMLVLVASASKKPKEAPENTILHLKLDNEIPERTSNNPFANFDYATMKSSNIIGLYDIVKQIKRAKNDDKVKGIFLDVSTIPAGMATVEEIRNALLDFKESKKFIYAYSEGYSQKAYYLATVADKIYINPQGMLDFRGLSAQIMFFKGALKKLEIDAQIIRHGKFKSAVEPFMLDKMSEANKEQTLTYINALWKKMIDGIAEQRNISPEKLNLLADSLKIETPQDAVKYKLADNSIYKDELLDEFKKILGLGEKENVSFMEIGKYMKSPNTNRKIAKGKDKIAIVFAQGDIESGEGDEETIGSERISKALRSARLNEDVKAVVLRVNSPGGSALASDVIWREVVLTKKVKPIVVSMGNVAASGGYYISCAANKIVANPNTITGSIGVFGIIPNFKSLFNNKLGITIDEVSTNKNASFGSTLRPLSEFEKNKIQNLIENIYQTFISHVAEGRSMTLAQVDSIGQGRVWSGVDAKRLGLIDEFGGLNRAIEIAAELAKIEDYKILSLPKQKDPWKELVEELTASSSVKSILMEELGEQYQYLKFLQKANKMKGVQARLPYEIYIE